MRANRRQRLPRIVSFEWIEQSWSEKTLLDEEREGPDLASLCQLIAPADFGHLGFALR